jgi:hypothetical protein
MVSLHKVTVEIDFSGICVTGEITGSWNTWIFSSNDLFFKRICPTGFIACTYEQPPAFASKMQQQFYKLIEQKVDELLERSDAMRAFKRTRR